MTTEEKGSIIINIANNYIGQQEIPPNTGFQEKWFEEDLKAVGWQKNFMWCVLFCKLVYKEAYKLIDISIYTNIIRPLFSANSQKLWKRFKEAGYTSDKPIPGAIAIWKLSKSRGHAGIVKTVLGDNDFITIEGNKGDKVSIVNRTIKNKTGYKLLGFIHPL